MPTASRSIYVQIDIRGSLERVWHLTQSPDLHRRWDLRFSDIDYLPRPNSAEPQRFRYSTRMGFGLAIRGEGESVGSNCDLGGQRTSALKFWSDDSKSLIRKGSGYWKYMPFEHGQSVRFLTNYDYDVRFGALGRLFDWLAFRPLIGWATAWSFDRLRIWLEKGIDPAVSIRLSLLHAVARLALAFIWCYQGAIPKLVFHHADELAMLKSAGLSDLTARAVRSVMGWAEIALALILLLLWRSRWPLWLALVLMPLAIAGVILTSPAFLVAAFNPVVLNVAVAALATIALLSDHHLPSAARCIRQPPKEEL